MFALPVNESCAKLIPNTITNNNNNSNQMRLNQNGKEKKKNIKTMTRCRHRPEKLVDLLDLLFQKYFF